jgi:DNA gyrase/topoisomerase IV subunit A
LFPLHVHAEASQRAGRRYASPGDDDAVVRVDLVQDAAARVVVLTRANRATVFPALELKLLRAGGRGVAGIRLAEGDAVIAAAVAHDKDDGIAVTTSRGRAVTLCERELGLSHRGGKGAEILKRGTVAVTAPPAVNLLPRSRPGEDGERTTTGSLPRVSPGERDDG